MALAATVVWEVRTAGSDTLCSGGYVAGGGGTDFSQQDAAQYTGTNLVIDGAVNTKVTSATHNFVAADVGNLMQITAGSGFTTGFFQIVSVAANAATLDRSAGTLGSTAGTFAVGGALATPGLAVANNVAGHIIYAKGSYTTTTNTANVAGGRLSWTGSGAQTAMNRFIGYTTTRTDGGKYTITLGATFVGPTVNIAGVYNTVDNVALVGNATSASKGLALTQRDNVVQNLKVSGFSVGGGPMVTVDNEAVLKNFEISGGATGGTGALRMVSSCTIIDGWIHGNAGQGAQVAGDAIVTFIRVMSAEHTGGTGTGFSDTSAGMSVYYGCAAWNNGGSDFVVYTGSGVFVRCIAGGSSGYNWHQVNTPAPDTLRLYYCAGKADTTAMYNTTPNVNVGFVTLTGDPFTDRANGDFSLNNTAGAGASCRGVSEVLFGLTTTYADIGPAQHQDAGGGGGGGTGPNVIVSSGAGSRGGSW